MKKYLTIVLLVSILGIGIFGFTSMGHTGGHDIGCIASSVASAQCPVGIIPMTLHHIQAYVSFFSVVPSTPFTMLALLALALCLAIFLTRLRVHKGINAHFRSLRMEKASMPFLLKIIRWLELLEHSPPVAIELRN